MPHCYIAEFQTMAIITLLITISAVSVFKGVWSSACDLSTAQECFGTASALVPRIYWHPLDIELLYDISQNFCDKKFEDCVQSIKVNCSENSVAPYLTVSDTTHFLCERDLSEYSSCIGNADLQEALTFCFQSFKEDYDVAMGDSTLSTDELKNSVCRSYERVFSCSGDMTTIMCDIRSRIFVRELLNAATRANRQVLNCD